MSFGFGFSNSWNPCVCLKTELEAVEREKEWRHWRGEEGWRSFLLQTPACKASPIVWQLLRSVLDNFPHLLSLRPFSQVSNPSDLETQTLLPLGVILSLRKISYKCFFLSNICSSSFYLWFHKQHWLVPLGHVRSQLGPIASFSDFNGMAFVVPRLTCWLLVLWH